MDVTVTVSTMDGGSTRFRAQQGINMLDALRGQGIPIPAACGGRGTCGKCQIIVDNPSAHPPTEAEKRLLSPEQLTAGLRLACTRVLTQDLTCRLPVALRDAAIATDSAAASGGLDPVFRRVALTIPHAGLDSQRSDEERLLEAAGPGGVSLSALRALPGAVRGQGGTVTALCREGLAVDIYPGAGPGAPLGSAVDIGTTTLAAYLMDLESGTELAVASRLNPQKAYGDDVISRTDYTMQQPDGLETLRRLIVDAVGGLTQELCAQAGVTPSRVVHMTIAGNRSCCISLWAYRPQASRKRRSYRLYRSSDFRAAQLGLLFIRAMVTTLPCVSGYVGADTVAVALAVGLSDEEQPCLILDIGTNGEIMLGDRKGILACSAAAGPAFEGAHIRYGMGGVAGAISRVEMDGALRVRTIADAPAAGICGSAIVDVTAGLLAHGAIDDRSAQPSGPAGCGSASCGKSRAGRCGLPRRTKAHRPMSFSASAMCARCSSPRARLQRASKRCSGSGDRQGRCARGIFGGRFWQLHRSGKRLRDRAAARDAARQGHGRRERGGRGSPHGAPFARADGAQQRDRAAHALHRAVGAGGFPGAVRAQYDVRRDGPRAALAMKCIRMRRFFGHFVGLHWKTACDIVC